MYLTASVQITEQLSEWDTGKAFLLIARIPTTQGTIPILLKQLFNWKTFHSHHWCWSFMKWVNKRIVSFWYPVWGLLVPYSVSLKSLQKSFFHQVSIALGYFPTCTHYLKHSVLFIFGYYIPAHNPWLIWDFGFQRKEEKWQSTHHDTPSRPNIHPFHPFMNNHWSQYPLLATCFLY